MPVIDIELSEKLTISCNILAQEGHGNLTMGHVTARRADQPYLHMNPHDLGLEEITPDDIILIDFNGNQLQGSGRRHSEYPIHTEIYKMYPQINCVIHTHPFYSIIVGATEGTIKPISHEGSLFAGIPLFEETSLLIRTPALGRAVAQCLDGRHAMLMRNHGVVVVGESIEAATVYAALLERAAKMQVMASQVGPVQTSSSVESEGKGEQVFYSKNIYGFWNYFVRNLRKVQRSG